MGKTAAELEVDKLNEEVKILRRQNSWIGGVVNLVPMITTFVAVAGLAFSFYQAQRAQNKEREDRTRNETQERINRIQNQIRTDKDQLVEFISNDRISLVRAGFLIDDLKSLVAQLPDGNSETKDVTKLLHDVAWDLRFDERRHFDFDVTALQRWGDYRQFWKNYPDSHQLFLANKYLPRIEKLHNDDAPCLEKLDYEAGTTILTYKNAGKTCNEELIGALMYGFGEHLRALKEGNQSNLLSREIEKLGELTNRPLAQKLSASL